MTTLQSPHHKLDPTELSAAALEQLPEVWRAQRQPLSDEDVTAFHCYALSPSALAPRLRTRTWLLAEIDELSERLSSLTTRFDTFGGISWDLEPPTPRRQAPALRARALSAVTKLMDILNMSESRVAELAGVSRNSVRNWRHGQDAYPATVARLFQISSLIGALERAAGRDRLETWLNESSAGSLSRRDLLSEPDGPAALAREAAPMLFIQPPSTLPSRELLGVEPELEAEDRDSEFAPQAFVARPRRQRPNPTP